MSAPSGTDTALGGCAAWSKGLLSFAVDGAMEAAFSAGGGAVGRDFLGGMIALYLWCERWSEVYHAGARRDR